jgi:acyl-CoA reductase-like NAD-dependent aldehyde dehydrogenase
MEPGSAEASEASETASAPAASVPSEETSKSPAEASTATEEVASGDGDAATEGGDPRSARPSGPSPFPELSPLDGTPLAPVEATDPALLPGMIERARRAQAEWAKKPVANRAVDLIRLKRRILERADEIAELLHRECGKPIEEAVLSEVLPNADLVDYWTASVEELLEGNLIELDALAYPGKLGRVVHDPRGVVALITPWNYPIAIPLRTLLPAVLAGNAVILKPSEVAARSGALVASLFAGLVPEGLVQIAQGGADVGAALLASDVDLVVFTGSVATGRRIAVACAERLLPCSLELGGKDAAIVLKDCNLERTARGLVWGAFTNAGQNCASIERVYVDRAIADKLVARVIELTKELRPGIDTAVLTTARQCEIVRLHLAQAVASGAEILAGGPPEDAKLDFPPTVVKITDESTPLMRDETFGPILPIFVVEGEEEAIRRANASRFGLTTSVWTKRVNHGQEIAQQLRSGVVTINNHGFTAAVPAAPWTGTGESGTGVTNGPHALKELTRTRFILEDRSGAKRELWWYPYTPVLRKIAFAMARARGGAGFFGRISAFFQLLGALPKRLMGG